MWGNWNLYTLLVGMSNSAAAVEISFAVPQNGKHSYRMARQLQEKLICVYIRTFTQIFIAALLMIAQKWKQPTCPSTGEWINKSPCIHPTDYDSVIESNKLFRHTATEMDLHKLYWTIEAKHKRVYTVWFTCVIFCSSRIWMILPPGDTWK